jgi:hypothetical protein
MRLFAARPGRRHSSGPYAVLRNYVVPARIISRFAPQQQCVLAYERRKRTKWERRRTKCGAGRLRFMNGAPISRDSSSPRAALMRMPRCIKPSIEDAIGEEPRPA